MTAGGGVLGTANTGGQAARGTQGAVNAPVKLEAADHDFGTVWAGEAVTHTFRLTNTGPSPLTIRGVNPTCGCTTTKDYAKIISPSGRTVIVYNRDDSFQIVDLMLVTSLDVGAERKQSA